MAEVEYKKRSWIMKVLLVWTHEGSEHFAHWLGGWKFDPLAVMPLILLLLIYAAAVIDPNAIAATVAALVVLSPIWLPVYLFVFFWISWIDYIRYMFWFSTEFVLLEVQLPQEVTRSPLAMETFFQTLFNTGGEATYINRIWRGSYRPVWSLEIASNEGRVGFYIHMRKVWRNIVEARLYGLFPEAKVAEVEDYVTKVPFNLEEYDIFGSEYKKGDIAALPIKTYTEYGLDKDPDAPEKQVDPITYILELLAQIGPGEHFWMQIIAKARKKDEWYGFYLNSDSYKDSAKKAIEKIVKDAVDRTQALLPKDEPVRKTIAQRGMGLLTEAERKRVDAVERSLQKAIFECGIRVVYLAKRERYTGINNGAVITFFQAFRWPDYNSLGVTRGTTYFDYPWQDYKHIRLTIEKRHLYEHYKERAYFYVPYDQEPVFLTTEELATLWHFPSSAVQTPGLNRVPSRRAEAPPNLPTMSS